MAPKRPAEQIDLTGGDDAPVLSSSQPSQGYALSQDYGNPPPPPKKARAVSGGSSQAHAGSSQAQPFLIYDEEEDGSQEAPDATQGYNEAEYGWGLYGVMHTKIVGVRFYNGYATVGEMVILRREPQNPYDRMVVSSPSRYASLTVSRKCYPSAQCPGHPDRPYPENECIEACKVHG